MPEPLKQHLDADVVALLALRCAEQWPAFDESGFTEAATNGLETLELKDRVAHIADALAEHLPDEYEEALPIVVRVAKSDVGEWASWPLCTFVERHGVDHPEASLDAMPVLTRYWSCEFAIRPFLDHHLGVARDRLRAWVDDPNEAVRRLASEGTRPLLPWGPRVNALQSDPEIGLELLAELRHDPSETVRRSVANHLNDVAKAHPETVVALLREWSDDGVDSALIAHAARTLVKQGHVGALELLGFTVDPAVEIDEFTCRPAQLGQGDVITLSARLRSTADADQLLVVDFVIHHVTQTGGVSPKVFKWTTVTIEPGETKVVSKRRRIIDGSTRTYHPGEHRVDLQLGGAAVASTAFTVVG